MKFCVLLVVCLATACERRPESDPDPIAKHIEMITPRSPTADRVSKWMVHPYSYPAFKKHLSGSVLQEQKRMLEAVTWDSPDRKDEFEKLVSHLAEQGLTYSGLSPAQSTLLDEWMHSAPAIESYGEQLGVGGGTFVDQNDIHDVYERFGGLAKFPLLARLEHGQRYGTRASPADSATAYAVYAPKEVAALKEELRIVAGMSGAQGDPRASSSLEVLLTDMSEKLGPTDGLLAVSDE
jgi:hypothetical protein